MDKNKNNILNTITVVLLIVCIVVILLRLFVVTHIEVNQHSMYPTYEDGQRVWGNKLQDIKRGNVIIFEHDDKVLIKRVVAVEGDKLYYSVVDDKYQLFIIDGETGEILTEQYTIAGKEVNLQPTTAIGVFKGFNSADNAYEVKLDELIVLGDNRPVSNDSRTFGAISVDSYLATVIDIVW